MTRQATQTAASERPARGLRRYPWFAEAETAVLGFLAWLLLSLVRLTVRVETVDGGALERCWRERRPVALAFWHGRAIMLPFFYRGNGAYIMNSTHRDGEIVTRALERFGINSTRGSSSRGAVAGMLGLHRAFRAGYDVALIPDGPRGPAGSAKAGAVELARSAGALLFPVSASCRLSIRGTGWDRMMIPLPGAKIFVVVGEAIAAEPGGGRETREALRLQLQESLAAASRKADRLAGRQEEDA